MKAKGFTLIELCICLALIGILAAIAIPNFTRMRGRARQAEVRDNLKAAFTAERSYFSLNDTYTNIVSSAGFQPERGNRYSYDLGGGVYQDRTGPIMGMDTQPPSFTGIGADTYMWGPGSGVLPIMPYYFTPQYVYGELGQFTMVAAGNIDNDEEYDQWSVSSVTRPSGSSSNALCSMGNNPAGEPCTDFNDSWD